MGGMLFDYDNDGDLDIYLTHDAKQENILYQNDGNAHFINVAEEAGVDYQGFGMGVDFADFNNDGHLDMYITNLFENTLYFNNGDGTFSDISTKAKVDDYGMGWGVICLDVDNDSYQDIYAINNSFYSPHPNVLYRNENGDGDFTNVSTGTPLESMFAGYGGACTDINNDGNLDIFVINSGRFGGNQLFLNESDGGNWITVKLVGTKSNRSGIGSRVEVQTENIALIDEVAAGTGYLSQNSLKLHFGLGDEDLIQKITLRWPSGITEIYENIPANKSYEFVEGEGIVFNEDVVTSLYDLNPSNISIQVFPNPFSKNLRIRFSNLLDSYINISLVDLSGRKLKSLDMNNTFESDQLIELDDLNLFSGIKEGTYILQINSKSFSAFKLINRVY